MRYLFLFEVFLPAWAFVAASVFMWWESGGEWRFLKIGRVSLIPFGFIAKPCGNPDHDTILYGFYL